jgi:hypothetical protein
MGFSRGQQPEFRQLIAAACQFCGIDPKGSEYRAWYEAALFRAVGKTSTTECDAGGDYDWVMAQFEEMASAGIKWQLRAAKGDAKRMLHEIRKTCGAAADVDEDYMLRIGARALGVDRCPPLYRLTREQRETILVACKQHIVRGQVGRLEREPQVSDMTEQWKRGQARVFREELERQANIEVDEPF